MANGEQKREGGGVNPFEEQEKQEKRIRESLDQIDHKIMVMSGKGGVGKSTVSVNLALELAKRGRTVGLMDVDLHGPTVPNLLGLNQLLVPVEKGLAPADYKGMLKVVSIASLMHDHDTAVIWRGPLKLAAIRQFIADILWEKLDYLVIDAPPGTGDEPLSVANNIPEASAVLVTTPQFISVANVRRAINFCRKVEMDILGLVENMSAFGCPHCGEEIALFGKDGGRKTAQEMAVPFLGEIPLSPEAVEFGDKGMPVVLEGPDSPVAAAYSSIADKITAKLEGKKPGAH
jgi:Mrp family chromosome partitioning ATPase